MAHGMLVFLAKAEGGMLGKAGRTRKRRTGGSIAECMTSTTRSIRKVYVKQGHLLVHERVLQQRHLCWQDFWPGRAAPIPCSKGGLRSS
eukprot:3581870-Pyramimonas_sp.AAC.1